MNSLQLQKDLIDALPRLVIGMIYKFSIHASKGPWTGVGVVEAAKHLQLEVDELMEAIDRNAQYEDILDECADIANMALIILHNYQQTKSFKLTEHHRLICNNKYIVPDQIGRHLICWLSAEHEGGHAYRPVDKGDNPENWGGCGYVHSSGRSVCCLKIGHPDSHIFRSIEG